MKRILLVASLVISAAAAKAQLPMPYGYMNGIQPGFGQFNRSFDTSHIQKKWFLTNSVGFSTGFMGYYGGNSTFLSAPMSVQLNRQLNNTVTAFAGVSVAPAYFPHAGLLYQPINNKYNNFMTTSGFGNYTTAQMGLMYTNPERTFSISGSIGVGRSDFYGRTPMYNPAPSPWIRNGK